MKIERRRIISLFLGFVATVLFSQCGPGEKISHDFERGGVLHLIDHLGAENVAQTPFTDLLSRFDAVEDDLGGRLSLIPELSTSRRKVWAATTAKSILGQNASQPPQGMEVRIDGDPVAYLDGDQGLGEDTISWQWLETHTEVDIRYDESYNKGLKCLVLDLEEAFNFEAVLPDAPVVFEVYGRRNWHPLDLVLEVDGEPVGRQSVGRDFATFSFPRHASAGSHSITLRPQLVERLSTQRPTPPRLLIYQIRVRTKHDVVLFFVPFASQPGFTNRTITARYLTDLNPSGEKHPLSDLYRILHDFTLDEFAQPVNPEHVKKKIVLENLSIDALLAPPDSGYSFTIQKIPDGCFLEFGTGLFAYRESSHDQGALFKVSVSQGDEKKDIFEKSVTLKPELLRDQLESHRISLEPWAGKTITLTFNTEYPDNKQDAHTPSLPSFAFWANPTLHRSGAPDSPPNVILISLDTLRADHLGCYGYDRPTSPFLDSLTADCALFANTYAQSSWTLPSHLSMLYSLNSASHQVYYNDQKVDASLPSVASVLRDRGYITYGFTGGGYVSSIYGFANGFDWYDEPVGGRKAPLGVDEAESLFAVTSDWLEEHRDRPFFLFLHTFQIHGPYASPEPWSSMFLDQGAPWRKLALRNFLDNNGDDYAFSPEEQANIVGLYDGEIRYTDEMLLKPLVERLRELGLYDNTLLIITSDHGEEFLEHGGWLHGRTLYDELIRVPLIVKFPASAHRGQRVEYKTRLIDIVPTILESVGIGYDRADFEGKSLAHFLTGKETGDRTFISDLAHKNVPDPCPALIATNQEHLKFIVQKSQDGIRKIETYDLRRDPGEKKDIFERAQRLREEVVRVLEEYYQERAKLQRSQERIRMDKDLEEKLKALGYLR